MLSVENLVKQYGELVAVDDVSFEAAEGAVFGLLGPNGAGKSTAINCISGLLQPTSGRVTVAGYNVQKEPRQAKRSLGVVPQELALYEDLPAVDNLRYWGRAYGLRGSELETRVTEVLGTIGLGDRAKDLPKTFSGGMKRRLNFGCGIVHRPPVMLLDEPTVGVDPQSRERLFELVEAERAKGTCIVYTTHYMQEAERLCDSVAIIDHGKMIARGSVAELRAQLGARDVLQLNGRFPAGPSKEAVGALAAQNGLDIEIISQEESSLTLTLSSASQHLPAVFQAISNAGGKVSETSLRSPNLETLFLLLTGKELRE
ncbi:MAG: ATP-binding cassette domain-containing protein [Xanthomonadales bacterium]|nr:ATP-binding cassette domain-containing protein [Gammaproteobacteria bacterium]MBT8053779.1 ATP-binding cassette domain-containing protein [Gammaproteobacteria bacterium]NND57278.1 ATP-binding cassette domain-containing protein [Xanthomonadales bacterium]NNK51616.1 ATP-binding cassette domain-containing protein [Xanthomonadales bacterium]